MKSFWFLLLPFSLAWSQAAWTHTEQGKVSQVIMINSTTKDEAKKEVQYLIAFVHSSYNGTELSIKLHCDKSSSFEYRAQFMIRTSPCDREFPEALASSSMDLLKIYFMDPIDKETVYSPMPPEDYTQVYFFKSKETTFRCEEPVFLENKGGNPLSLYKVKFAGITGAGSGEKRAAASISTRHPALTLPADAIYLLIVQVAVTSDLNNHHFTVEVDWRGQHGYLSIIDWPLLPFYGTMCGVYGLFAFVWLSISACQWKNLLGIHFWIGAVIILGMLENAVFYADYQTVNATGTEVFGAVQFAEIISCLKRTLARMLLIVVSVGFGVVKPRLGSTTFYKVVGVGSVYFILSSIEAINRTSNNESYKEKLLVSLPLTLLEVGIFWWIFTSLVKTKRALRFDVKLQNKVKLSLYRHFTNTLIFCVLASIVFMSWSLYMHTFTSCLKDWTELWVDTAFWYILFSVLLLMIMILWRPTNDNQPYALDTTTMIKDELNWVEEHIPSSLANKGQLVLNH